MRASRLTPLYPCLLLFTLTSFHTYPFSGSGVTLKEDAELKKQAVTLPRVLLGYQVCVLCGLCCCGIVCSCV